MDKRSRLKLLTDVDQPSLVEVEDHVAATVIAVEDTEVEASEVVTDVEVAEEDAMADLVKEATEVDATEAETETEDTGNHLGFVFESQQQQKNLFKLNRNLFVTL